MNKQHDVNGFTLIFDFMIQLSPTAQKLKEVLETGAFEKALREISDEDYNGNILNSIKTTEFNSMGTLYEQWMDALQNVSIQPLSDDTCCKLLAIVYVFGGSREDFTLNLKFKTDIQYAQKRLKILGGEIPDVNLIPTLQKYIKELIPEGMYGEWLKPSWATELVTNRYNINL